MSNGELFASSDATRRYSDDEVIESPLTWALLGLDHASSTSYGKVSGDELRSWLDVEISDSTVKAVQQFDDARYPRKLATAIRSLDLDKDAIGDAMEVADKSIQYLTHNDKKPGQFRHSYIPKLINEANPDGNIYMCKTVNGEKAMMAWDLNSSNIVVKVDTYEPYEVLGWEKLKDFPHGERQIREQYGDELSDAVLTELCGSTDASTTKRRSPSAEQLTISVGRRERQKFKLTAEEVGEQFEESGELKKSTKRLILFPTGTSRNLSDNWWITGSFKDDANVGFANCNKKTYKYLSQYEQVLHVDDYISGAEDVEVVTSSGTKRLGSLDEFIVYTVSQESYERYCDADVVHRLPEVLAEQAAGKYESPDLDGDETVVLVSQDTAFEARPLLRDAEALLTTDTTVRGIGDAFSVGHEYIVYAKARLGKWDWDSPELHALEENCWNINFDNGGFELVETLAQLHDEGRPLYSESPERRWEQ